MNKTIAALVLFCFCEVSFLTTGYYAVEAYLHPTDSIPVDVTLAAQDVQPYVIDEGFDNSIKVEVVDSKKKKRESHDHV